MASAAIPRKDLDSCSDRDNSESSWSVLRHMKNANTKKAAPVKTRKGSFGKRSKRDPSATAMALWITIAVAPPANTARGLRRVDITNEAKEVLSGSSAMNVIEATVKKIRRCMPPRLVPRLGIFDLTHENSTLVFDGAMLKPRHFRNTL